MQGVPRGADYFIRRDYSRSTTTSTVVNLLNWIRTAILKMNLVLEVGIYGVAIIQFQDTFTLIRNDPLQSFNITLCVSETMPCHR